MKPSYRSTATARPERANAAPSLDYVDLLPLPEPVQLVYRNTLEKEIVALADQLHESAGCLHALLFGQPGLGKTATLRQLERASSRRFWWVRSDRFFTAFFGGTSSNLAAIFRDAEASQAVLVFDDFEVIGRRRDDPRESGESRRLVTTLISTLDGYRDRVTVLAATNLPSVLDPAVLRRFDHLLPFETLDDDSRARLLRIQLGRRAVPKSLSKAAATLSPAEILDVLSLCNGSKLDTAAVQKALLRRKQAIALMKVQR